ncbi:MAG: hypothetical protein L6R42_005566 [Xanthoria sp. 1 TBL-2021]|nr:MAG: hypothetical protein L6R42_005566 [Xanthoria sp. 1 TBL-2021]
MEFLNNAFYDGPQYLSGHLEDALYKRSPGGPYFNRGQRWPCSGGFCSGSLPDPFWNESEHGRSQYDALYSSWPQHPHRTFDRAQSLDEAYLHHTETAIPSCTESYRTAFQHLKPMQGCGCQERRGYRPCSYMSSPRCDTRREQHDPSFPFDVHRGFGHCGENDFRRRTCSNSNWTVPGYTVEEPEGSELPTSPRLPHRARSRSQQGSHDDKCPGFLNLGSITVAGTEDRPRVQTISSSGSPSHESPHAAQHPSPHPGLVHGDQPDSAGPQEDSPSSTLSRHPSSPRSPCHEGFYAPDDIPPAPDREEDLGAIYHHILRQNEKLKRKRDKLHRLRLKLFRRAEKLQFWEVELMEREAREGRTVTESSGYDGFPH